MARYQHLPLFQATYAYTKEIYRLKTTLPKIVRHDLGGELFRSSVRALRLIIFANGSPRKEKALKELSLEVETHWIYLRLLCDIKAISTGQFQVASERLSLIAPQVIAWMS